MNVNPHKNSYMSLSLLRLKIFDSITVPILLFSTSLAVFTNLWENLKPAGLFSPIVDLERAVRRGVGAEK